jgi:hypothetical protein
MQRGNYKQLVAQLRFNANGRDADLRQRLDESLDLAAAGLKRKLVSSDADSVAITIPPRIFAGLPRPEVVAARVRSVLDVLKAAVPDNQKDGTYIVRAIALCVLVVLLALLMAHRSTG